VIGVGVEVGVGGSESDWGWLNCSSVICPLDPYIPLIPAHPPIRPSTHPSTQDLDYTAVIAPKADAAFAEWEAQQAAATAAAATATANRNNLGFGSSAAALAATAAGGSDGTNALLQGPLQPFCVKAALLLWLWFDQECARMAWEVRARIACGIFNLVLESLGGRASGIVERGWFQALRL